MDKLRMYRVQSFKILGSSRFESGTFGVYRWVFIKWKKTQQRKNKTNQNITTIKTFSKKKKTFKFNKS